MKYLHENKVNAYIPDNQFHSRDPTLQNQISKHGQRHQKAKQYRIRCVMPASEFHFDLVGMTCDYPAGNRLNLRGIRETETGLPEAYFEGTLLQCRHCEMKTQCMQNPSAVDHRKGKGRQVSFALNEKRKPTHTDWMKHRVDSPQGKLIYSHQMSVVEPVFGSIGTNKKLSRFSLRSKEKVQSQWWLYCLVHTIEKLANYGAIAA